MRVNALLRPGGDPAAVLAAIDASGLHDGDGDAWLRVGGVKLAVDGGFEGGLMREAYSEPWAEGGSFKGLQIVTRPAFEQVVSGLNDRGWRVATHAVGDAAIDLVLDTYEQANARKAITGRPLVDRARLHRPSRSSAADQGAGPGARRPEPSLSGRSEPVVYRGPTRAALTTPVRSYLDARLPVSSGTDAPVVLYPPLWTLYHFVTRDTLSGGVLGLDQRVTRAEALRMATIANAWLTMGRSATRVLAEAGKLADLVVLSDDPLTCPEPRLRDAQVLMTIVGGRVVHDQLQ